EERCEDDCFGSEPLPPGAPLPAVEHPDESGLVFCDEWSPLLLELSVALAVIVGAFFGELRHGLSPLAELRFGHALLHAPGGGIQGALIAEEQVELPVAGHIVCPPARRATRSLEVRVSELVPRRAFPAGLDERLLGREMRHRPRPLVHEQERAALRRS